MKKSIAILIAVLTVGLLIRAWITPYTSGSDIAQFAGFADTLRRRGLCFYHYADGSHHIEEGWPYSWPCPYGPLAVFLMYVARLFAPSKVDFWWSCGWGSECTYYVYVPVNWIIASKAVFIVFDTLSAILIYLIVLRRTSSTARALAASALYYLNPVTIYVSVVYGMLDPVSTALILLAILFLYTDESSLRRLYIAYFIAGLVLGLAATTKPNTLFAAAAVFLVAVAKNLRRRLLVLSIVAGLVCSVLAPFIPFDVVCPGTIEIFTSILLDVGKPGYNPPIQYSFNGFTSLATFINEKTGFDMLWLINNWWIAAALALLPALYAVLVKKKLDFAEAAYIFYLVYTTTYWRVNYQYFAVLAGLVPLYIFLSRSSRQTKALTLIHIAYVGLWLFIFPTSWWAHVHIREPNQFIIELLDRLSMMVFAEEVYLVYSVILTVLSYSTLTAIYIDLFAKVSEETRSIVQPATHTPQLLYTESPP